MGEDDSRLAPVFNPTISRKANGQSAEVRK
jgi:hypothetical protein